MIFLRGGSGNEFVSSLPLMTFAKRTSHALGLVLVDIATGWMFGYPDKTKSAKAVIASVIDFSPLREIKLMHSDPAPELRAAIGSLEIAFESAPVGVKGASGIAGRMVRTVVEGSRTLLENAGLLLVCWPFAMRCFCLLYNVSHTFFDGTTPWTRRHVREFGSPLIPFGCLVDFKSTVEETKKLPKFSPQAIPGVFLGYDLSPGGQWKRVCLVAALDDFRDADFTRVGPRPCPHIHHTRDIYFDSDDDPFFPLKVMYDISNRSIAGSPEDISRILLPVFAGLQSSHPPPVSSEGGAPFSSSVLPGGGPGGGSSSSKEPSSCSTEDPPKQEKTGENGTWVNGRFVRN